MGLKETLKKLRKQKGWDQKQAAKAARIPLTSLRNYEQGARPVSTATRNLVKLADAFEVSIHFLIGPEPRRPKSVKRRAK
jgi:transcriptional regulator with XRE-family HTH domain